MTLQECQRALTPRFGSFFAGKYFCHSLILELMCVLGVNIHHGNFLSGHNDDSHHGEVDDNADGDDSLLLTLSIGQYWRGLVPGK